MLITDALCVRFVSENEVLAGIGNQLQYFYAEDLKTVRKICPTATKYKISDIQYFVEENEIKLIASAGSTLLVTSIVNHKFCHTFTIKINDWINAIHIDASLSNTVYCVTAHNRACQLLFEYESKKHASVIKRSRCPEISTAYSSLINGESWESLLLFAGTAFGELIIWRPVSDTGTILLRVPNSHNGVIFDIQLNRDASLLTTCSDDRSVQLWKFLYDDESPVVEKIKRCFAHVSRVFRSKIIKNNENFYILSVGEDSHVCLWDSTGTLLYKKFIEECGSIWGLDYCEVTLTLAVVTNNGRIVKIPLPNKFNGESTKIEMIENSSVTKLKYMCHESNRGFLICLTSTNQILVYDINDSSKLRIELQLDSGYKYCVMETYKHRLYLVTTDGDVLLYEFSSEMMTFEKKCHEKVLLSSKGHMIRSLTTLDDESLLICSSQGVILSVNALDLQKSSEYRIPKCSEPWITSGTITKTGFLIGDRCGHLHLYQLGHPDPIHSLRRLHGNMGITQIVQINNKTFKTTGHDGTLKTIIVENDSLKQIFTQKTNINFIERSIGSFTFGFNSSYFLCYHEKDGVLVEHNCGGGNRQYDLFLENLQDGTFSLAVIQQRKVKLVTFRITLSDTTFLQFPDIRWHHLSCNFLTVNQINAFPLLISGGEDTYLKFYEFSPVERSLRLIKTSTQHNSGIKSIISAQIKDETFIISVGSRAKICVTRIRSVFKDVLIEEELQFMLYERVSEKEPFSFDPEASFTSVSYVSHQQEHFLICGCSDGCLRRFKLSLGTKNPLTLEKEIFYGRSILHVKTVIYQNYIIILTMGTDGIINFWNFKTLNTPIHKIKHHDSGIHAYDIHQQEHQLLIATGGDDQSIVVTKVILKTSDANLIIEPHQTLFIPDLHTAQVTGVRFLNEQKLLTAGVDQFVYLLHLNKDLDDKIIKKSRWTSIEDIKGLLHFKNFTIVYGNGIEIF